MKKWKDNLKDIINDKMPENMQSTEIPKKRNVNIANMRIYAMKIRKLIKIYYFLLIF